MFVVVVLISIQLELGLRKGHVSPRVGRETLGRRLITKTSCSEYGCSSLVTG